MMERGHAHMKLLLRKNEVCTYGASVEVRREKGSTSSVVCDATFPKGEGLSHPPPLTSYLLPFTFYFTHRSAIGRPPPQRGTNCKKTDVQCTPLQKMPQEPRHGYKQLRCSCRVDHRSSEKEGTSLPRSFFVLQRLSFGVK